MKSEKTKRMYRSPALKVQGSIESLTKGGTSGTTLDAAFPYGTPLDQITFS